MIDNTDQYSISCWVRIVTAGFGGIYCQNTIGWTKWGIEFTIQGFNSTDGDKICFSHCRSDAIADNNVAKVPYIADNIFHHYVATRSGTAIKLYKDGVLADSKTLAHNTITNYANGYIGQYINGNNNTPQGVKDLENLRIFNRCLSPEEVLKLYQYEVR